MAVRFKTPGSSDLDAHMAFALEDIRELLFLILHTQLARPDTDGHTQPVRDRLERFIEERMVDEDRLAQRMFDDA